MTEASGLASALASRLRALWGTEAAVTGVRPLPGGASRESWDVRVRTADGAERRLILLREAGGRAPDPDKKVAVEAAAMTAARTAGVPVAEIYDYGAGDPHCALGQAYLLMEHLDGETIPRRLLRDEAYAAVRPGLARRLGEVLARIHQVNPASVRGLPRVDALSQVTGLYQAFGEPRPALEIGLRWLAGHRPAPAADALVHGDFRTGNLMVGEDGLHGVLDWELAHLGDPRHDLGWLCTKALAVRLGEPRRRVRYPCRPDGRLRRRRRHPAGRGNPALVGAVRHGAMGAALPPAGRAVPRGGRAVDRVRGARPARL